MRTYRNCYMLFPASFKLALMCCSCVHHLLPWVASCSLVLHHASVCIMPCSCVVCLLCCVLLLDSSRFIAFVRIRSSMLGSSSSVCLLHGLVLLPSGISGKMIVTLDLTTIFAMLVVSMLSLCRVAYHLFIKPPKLPWKPLTFSPFLANRCLAMLPLLFSPSYSVVSCRWSWRLLHVRHVYVGISQYLLFN